ncbi:aldose 1-epimerase family protein [Anaerotruncus rubiinfantis]|jgi:galactose mutarotase-like enzyme|uniref:aldose 1-epimerase family protein n=1 Tax=Anaerotruncus rubiinfantis TaxID=1720200 RepID=UPI0008364865|nr:aldose 1-epimerase family protein [Anaerotruncus rubiinfantis]
MSEIILKSGGSKAICSTVGAEVTSFIPANGREYIWQADPAIWPNHTPMLFPACGATMDDHAYFDGVEYPLGKHGFTRKIPFTLGKHGVDFVEYIYESNAETLRQYPFEFVLHVTHTICENGFSTVFLVENKSGKRMPMCIGGHPGFACPIYDGETFNDYVLKFEYMEDGKNLTMSDGTCIDGEEYLPDFHNSDTLALDHALFDPRDALIFDNLKSRVVKLLNPKTGKGFSFDFHKFDVLAVWSIPNKNGNYLCLEPWCGMPAVKGESGEFSEKKYCKWIEPGECFKVGYSLEVIE